MKKRGRSGHPGVQGSDDMQLVHVGQRPWVGLPPGFGDGAATLTYTRTTSAWSLRSGKRISTTETLEIGRPTQARVRGAIEGQVVEEVD